MKQESFNYFYKRYAHALTNISEAKEHSINGGFLCVGKQAIQTSNDISEAHEAFYKPYSKDLSEVQWAFCKSTKDYLITAWCIKEKWKLNTKDAPRFTHIMWSIKI